MADLTSRVRAVLPDVRRDLEGAEVLRLTRWAWERCVHALHFGTRGGEGGEGEAEVTVGIVKG